MGKIRFDKNGDVYPGTLMEISDSKIVLDFPAGIPAALNLSGITVLDEKGAVKKEYPYFTTIYHRYGTRIILSNDGSVIQEDTAGHKMGEILEIWREEKLKEISETCKKVIHYGIELNGEHYSLTDQDQTNLFGKQAQLLAGASQVEYHADGEPCRYFLEEEMTDIIAAAMAYVTYHTTYCNALNIWIRSAESLEEVQSIYYGCAVPEEYQSVVLKDLIMQPGGGADETVS